MPQKERRKNMSDSKKHSQRALFKAFPNTEEGLAQFLHAQLYFKYIPQYIYHMSEGTNKFLENPLNNVKPVGAEFEEVDELIKTLVNHTGAVGADPDTNVYHAKVLRKEDAVQFFHLKEDLVLGDLPKTIMPYEHARKILIENPGNIAVIDCVCRTLRADKGCHPRQVCILVGNPWVDWVMDRDTHMNARKISQAEALEILEAAHNRGDVHAAFFKDATAGRFYHICNCCSCCCTALAAQNYLNAPMFAGSGYTARIDETSCTQCGVCVDACNFLAVEQGVDRKITVNEDLCKGCEACVGKCPTNAISLGLLDENVLAPMNLGKLKAEKEV